MNPSDASPAPSLWRPDLATGIPELDEQHRELLGQIGSLFAAARQGDAAHTREALAYLERYAREHFATEERIMRAVGYPQLVDHLALHAAFVEGLEQRKREFGEHRSETMLLVDLLCWMDEWLRNHVRDADAGMARFLRDAPGWRATRSP